jgi:hypothetical protein
MSHKAVHESEMSKTAVAKGQVRRPLDGYPRVVARPPRSARHPTDARAPLPLPLPFPRRRTNRAQVLVVATNCDSFPDGTPTGLW